MKNPFVLAIASAIITAGLIKAVPALAETPTSTQTYVSYVKTADLNLASEGGQRALDRRLAQAAREVCGVPSDSDLIGQNKARECREEAVQRAGAEREALLAAANRGAVIAITASR
ncbi:MAG TPA: UrcA family protein [Sphingomicrobium sp.]|jgi:UrcA family protein